MYSSISQTPIILNIFALLELHNYSRFYVMLHTLKEFFQ